MLQALILASQALLFAALLANCSSDNQVLASYEKDQKIHTVKRKQLRWLIKMQGQNANMQKPSTALQQQVLKSYIFSQIIAQEAASGAKESKQYQKQVLFLKEKAKLAAYELYLREKDENFQFDFIEAQFIFLSKEGSADKAKAKTKGKGKGKGKGIEKDAAKKLSLSKERQELLNKLNSPQMSDADIEEQVYQISEHPRYRLQGGYLDPICTSCSTNPLSDIMEDIKKAKSNNAKFIAIPRPNALWLVRVVKEYTVDEDDIQDKLENFYRKRARVARKYIAKLPPNAPQRQQLQAWFNQEKMESLAAQSSKWLLQKEKSSFAFSKLNQIRKKRKYELHESGKLKSKLKSPSNLQGKESQKIIYKDDTPLYSIDGKDYKYSDLQREIESLQKGVPSEEAQEIKDSSQQIRIMHAILIPLRLLAKEEDFQKAMQSGIYDFVYSFIKNRTRALRYYEQEREKVQVEPKEVLKNYQANKDIRYKGKSRKEGLELARKELKQSLFAQWRKQKQEELSKKHKLTIKNKLLKADEV